MNHVHGKSVKNNENIKESYLLIFLMTNFWVEPSLFHAISQLVLYASANIPQCHSHPCSSISLLRYQGNWSFLSKHRSRSQTILHVQSQANSLWSNTKSFSSSSISVSAFVINILNTWIQDFSFKTFSLIMSTEKKNYGNNKSQETNYTNQNYNKDRSIIVPKPLLKYTSYCHSGLCNSCFLLQITHFQSNHTQKQWSK